MTVTNARTEAVPNYGEVFTRRWVVETLLDLTGYTADRDLAELRLIEPSTGSGAFLFPAIERLLDSARTYGRDVASLTDAIRAWELQPGHAVTLRKRMVEHLSASGVARSRAESLARTWVEVGDYLLADDVPVADVVIGNPPYVRLEDLPTGLTAEYRRRWPTMGGRADVYVGFIERSLSILRPDGRLGFICADRWMRNQYGDRLRRMIASRFSVEHVWSMHDVDAFDTQVAAYPAIIVLAANAQREAVVADTTAAFGADGARALVDWTLRRRTSACSKAGVTAHRLPHWFSGHDSWPTGSPARIRLVEWLSDRFRPLHDEETGTKVSIGVATGADRVFVTTDPHVVEPDRMMPLSMVRDLVTGDFRWSGHYLVNPWDRQGRLVDLAAYPRLRRYLQRSGSTLRDRHTAKKAPYAWYRTIDKVHHDLMARPKLLLQDMRTTIHPVLEPGGYYPHHNLYYVVSDKWEMEVLGGILLSRIAQAFIEAYCVRMRGGTLRFQAQYLKRIRVPSPDQLDASTTEALKDAFRRRDVTAATVAAASAYRIDLREYELA